ncbi:LptF/LptG family permease [Nitratifractor sp.]
MIPVPGRRYARYIVRHYLRHFLILLFGLSVAVTFIDYLQNLHRFQVGANLRLLYAVSMWEYFVQLLFPLVSVFAFVWTMVRFIRDNTLVSLFSFGYAPQEVLRPFLFVAVGIYLLFAALAFTPFAYAHNRSSAILHNTLSQQKVRDLFFKHDRSFVYIRELDPVRRVLHGVIRFGFRGGKLVSILQVSRARYSRDGWTAPRAEERVLRFDSRGEAVGFTDHNRSHLTILRGYRPRVVKLIYKGRSLRIPDALAAWKLLAAQHLDSSKIRATLYNTLVMPLFAPALVILLFFRIPPHRRYLRLEMIWLVSLASALLVWAFFFAMYRLGRNGVIDPNWGMLLPAGLLCAWALREALRRRV